MGLLTLAVSLGSCGTLSGAPTLENPIAARAEFAPLAAQDLNKSLVPGAVAEVLALRVKMGSDKTLTNDKIAALSSTSIRISDSDGQDVGFLVLTGPGVSGDFWSALGALDDKTAKANGFYNSLIGTQPQTQGVQWLEQGVTGLKQVRANLDKLGGPAALEQLVLVNRVALAAKLKNGKLVNLSDLREVPTTDLQAFREQDGKLVAILSTPQELRKINADWAIVQQASESLIQSGALIKNTISATTLNPMGAPVDSRLDYRKFAVLMSNTKVSMPSMSSQSMLKGQTEQETKDCFWFICAYQYNSTLPESVISDYAGGYAQNPRDYANVPDTDRYMALELNAVTSGGVVSPTTQGCGASALISLMDYHWRRTGVTWFGKSQPLSGSAQPIYNKSNIRARVYPWVISSTSNWSVANNPVMIMGAKNTTTNRSKAMDLVGTRASNGIGTVVTSQMNGGVYNFLQEQKSGYSLGPGASFTARMYYADGTGPASGGTGAGIIRDIMGNYNYPFIAMYPTGATGGHVSMVTNYMVYYPSNAGQIQIYIKDVDFNDVFRRVDNAFSFGFFGYR